MGKPKMDRATAATLGEKETFDNLPRDVQQDVINAAIQAGYEQYLDFMNGPSR